MGRGVLGVRSSGPFGFSRGGGRGFWLQDGRGSLEDGGVQIRISLRMCGAMAMIDADSGRARVQGAMALINADQRGLGSADGGAEIALGPELVLDESGQWGTRMGRGLMADDEQVSGVLAVDAALGVH